MDKVKLCGTITLKYKFEDVIVPFNFYDNEKIEYIKDNLDIILDLEDYEVDNIEITGEDDADDPVINKSDWEADYYHDCMKEGTLYED